MGGVSRAGRWWVWMLADADELVEYIMRSEGRVGWEGIISKIGN